MISVFLSFEKSTAQGTRMSDVAGHGRSWPSLPVGQGEIVSSTASFGPKKCWFASHLVYDFFPFFL